MSWLPLLLADPSACLRWLVLRDLFGRPADDPANTTGVAMLPKGGNPSLTDADLTDIVHFLKSLTG